MKTRRALPLIAVIMAFVLASCSDTALVFQLQDSVSGAWVWDASVLLQDRLLISYYQTDAGPIPQKLTHLKPGASTLSISAPGYEPVSLPVTLTPGKNRLSGPVKMVGLEIPGLDGFSAFESIDNGDVVVQLRPLDSAGKAIINHPCIDLWIGCVVSEQVRQGVPVRVEGDARSTRGDLLFRGAVQWSWDARPESLFRYSARIPQADVQSTPSLYRVIDYLIVVPDPRKISRMDLEGIMTGAWPTAGLASGNGDRREPELLAPAIESALNAEKGRLRWFFITSWDVRVRQS
ncbi:MAG: hypothetical protein ABSF77_20965 [Spirochaetia bacterium]